jgi:hypothetical protein
MNTINQYDFICLACKKHMSNGFNLNRHLKICTKYDEFIKTYTPPEFINCNNCEKKFINNDSLQNHKINYCNK